MTTNYPEPSTANLSESSVNTQDMDSEADTLRIKIEGNKSKETESAASSSKKTEFTERFGKQNYTISGQTNESTKKQISIDEHKSDMVQNFNRFRNEHLFTDIFIYVEGVEFPCHKVILCAASCYFKAMFSCDLKESRLGKVFIENISPWTMKRILDFIYTGKIEINYENVIEIFNAAVMFQLGKLANKCAEFLNDHIDLTNCVEILVFSSMHQLDQIEAATFQFILDNFMQIIHFQSICISKTSGAISTPGTEAIDKVMPKNPNRIPGASSELNDLVYFGEFVRLNEQTFSNLIKSDSLNVSREIYVYYAIKKWMDFRLLTKTADTPKVTNQKQTYENLFKNIRLNALAQNELEYILCNDEMVRASDNLTELIKYHLGEANDSSSILVQKNKISLESISYFKDNDVVTSKLKSATTSINPMQPNLHQTSSSTNSTDDLNLTAIPNNTKLARFRPSTIPRDYLCLLRSNQFQYYDFYKSKWDILGSWPPCLLGTKREPHQSSEYCNIFANNEELNEVSLDEPTSRANLGGYSTVLINNILYVTGGYLIDGDSNDNQAIELVDRVWRLDPIKNEWTKCKTMLRKRAFHISISLEAETSNAAASKKSSYIFLFYGLCAGDATANTSDSVGFPFRQCLIIDVYNLETDQWSKLKNNDSLLEHHIFQSINNQNRLILNGYNANSDESQQGSEFNINLLNQLIEHQLAQYKLVMSLKNLIYILKENCIHCYEFNCKLEQLVCLPYFRLPEKLSTFVLAAAVSSDIAPSTTKSLFTWYSDDSDSSPKDSFEIENGNLESEVREKKENFKEALIYLLNMQLGVLYQFYPAKNKLKKLPNLLLKHSSNETSIICMKSKLYVTGGILSGDEQNETGTAIEEYDDQKETWTVFMNSTEARISPTTSVFSIQETDGALKSQNNGVYEFQRFFKLKMALV